VVIQLRKLHIIFSLAPSASVANFARETATSQSLPAPRVGDFEFADGTVLKDTYFLASKPGPGVILYRQANRTRESTAGQSRSDRPGRRWISGRGACN
jgi:hypothetical protein